MTKILLQEVVKYNKKDKARYKEFFIKIIIKLEINKEVIKDKKI